MSLSAIDKLRPEMVKRGVSEVARSPRGFLRQYRKAGGRFSKLSPYWRNRRNNFVKRHLAQARNNGEKLWDPKKKKYSRRGLALVAWAYDPKRKRKYRKNNSDNSSAWAVLGVGAFIAWIITKKLCSPSKRFGTRSSRGATRRPWSPPRR